ncbi:MAG: hypothetical protein ACLRXQ_04015 [Phascolarctobacterium faecium]
MQRTADHSRRLFVHQVLAVVLDGLKRVCRSHCCMAVGFFVRALAAQGLGKYEPEKEFTKNKYLFNITI